MSTPGKYQAYLSQSTSEIPSGDDIEVMIARLDTKWRELKKLLRAEEDSTLEEQPASPDGPEGLEQAVAANTSESLWSSLLPSRKEHFELTPLEADAIVTRVEKLDKECEIRERLVKVQWQNRGLVAYSIICTILFLYMLLSVFFFNDSYALNATGMEPARGLQRDAGAKPSAPATSPATGAPAPSTAGGAMTSPPREANAPASPQETLEMASGKASPTLVSAAKEAETPTTVEYVGSFTSNKYHYRSCKWAKYIGPRNTRVFHSVAEAQKAGYISCPACQPPMTDEPKTAAR